MRCRLLRGIAVLPSLIESVAPTPSQILNVSAQVPNYFESQFLYCKIPLLDVATEEVRPHLRRAFEFINDALRLKSRVFIHCIAGASRSVTVAIAYIMYRRSHWLCDVLKHVRDISAVILVHVFFLSLLLREPTCLCRVVVVRNRL
jgi:protein-tyrosine phosphatase